MKKTIIIMLIMCTLLPLIFSACTPAHDHEYTEEITKQPTCKDVGEKTFTCTICKKAYTEEVPVTEEHTYTEEVTKEATCTEKGEKTYTCSVCGHKEVKDIEATGHQWKEKITKKATCTKDGKKTLTCTVCGEKETVVINKLGHDYKIKTTAATYLKTGKTVKTCSRCGKVVKSTIPKLTKRQLIKGTWSMTSISIGAYTITSGTPTTLSITFTDNKVSDNLYSCTLSGSPSIYNGTAYYSVEGGGKNNVKYLIFDGKNFAGSITINAKNNKMEIKLYDNNVRFDYGTAHLEKR